MSREKDDQLCVLILEVERGGAGGRESETVVMVRVSAHDASPYRALIPKFLI